MHSSEIWNDLSSESQSRCVEFVSYCSEQMTNLKFPVYGSLYLTSAFPSGVGTIGLHDGFHVLWYQALGLYGWRVHISYTSVLEN
jgi:hypothetical protein